VLAIDSPGKESAVARPGAIAECAKRTTVLVNTQANHLDEWALIKGDLIGAFCTARERKARTAADKHENGAAPLGHGTALLSPKQ
jgi:hypothetical protein